MKKLIYKEESYKIIGACMTVHRELGVGFLEEVYQEALEVVFSEMNVPYEREKKLNINFRGTSLKKKYCADFLCYGVIIVELKALSSLLPVHDAQLLNYLKATSLQLGILVNFGEESLIYKRIVL